jgi:hypothetical protein
MFGKLMPLLLLLGVSMILPSPAMAELGFQSFEAAARNADGSPDTQAGSHPFQWTTSFRLKTALNSFGEAVPSADIRDIRIDMPPGLTGSATAVPPCSQELFTKVRPATEGKDNSTPSCGNASVVGIAEIFFHPEYAEYVPVYSLVPPPGTPVEFGYVVEGAPVVLASSLRTNEDYGLRMESANTSQALRIFANTVTFWGVPGDPRHDEVRGSCLSQGTGGSTGERCPVDVAPKPLLTLPTSCSGPLTTTIAADSWQERGGLPILGPPSELALPDGCNQLDFGPSLAVQPDTTAAGSPTGLEIGVSLPQSENSEGLAEAEMRKILITPPPGVAASPSAAAGMEACTEAQIALHSTEPAQCPNASKVGSAKLEIPLLEHPLEGWVYIAQQNSNPFESLLGLYLLAEGSGVRIKLAVGVEANPSTGQLTARFEERPAQRLSFPELPFGELKLKLFGGPRATLATPRSCGTFQAMGLLTPWSSEAQAPVGVSSSFAIDSGCASQFDPSFTAGTTNNQAGDFSPFTMTFSRSDEDQYLNEIAMQAPPGLLGMVSKVPLCGEPQAQLGACPAASQIGHVTVSAGPGPDPVLLPRAGRPEDPVYLTGPYNGAPFGLSIVDHAEAGPFDLGTVIVRTTVSVDPHTAQVGIKSQPLPRILQGIPTQIRSLTIDVDREGFMFNPTSCDPLAVAAAAVSTEGANAALASRFQAAGCQALAFKPGLAVSTRAKASKIDGASLHVRVTSGAGQANIAKVKIDLPKQLPARLETLQKACRAGVFEANPASCPAASLVGTGTAHTRVLSSQLSGPVYLVSHGRAGFPDLVVVLQGEGVTFDLDGLTGIDDGITSATFRTVPDVPISSFQLSLPEGPSSVLAAYLPAKAGGSLCGRRLAAPTAITGQNGAVIRQSTRIAISGCPKHRRAHKSTNRQSRLR